MFDASGGKDDAVKNAVTNHAVISSCPVDAIKQDGERVRTSVAIQKFPGSLDVMALYLGTTGQGDRSADQKKAEAMNLACLQKMASGDLNFLVGSNDEMGKAIGQIQFYLNEMSKESAAFNDSIGKGILTTRFDVGKFPGKYAETVNNMNLVVDSTMRGLHLSFGALEVMSRGEVPQKITREYPGEYGRMSSHLNKAVDGFNGLLECSKVMQKMAVNDMTSQVKGRICRRLP